MDGIKTLTRDEYEALRRHGYAGTRRSLESDMQAGWAGTHWYMFNAGGRGVTLAPCNVEGKSSVK